MRRAMSKVKFKADRDRVEAYSMMFDLKLTPEEIDTMGEQLPGVLAGIEDLWDVDVAGTEMSVIFPVDR